MRRPTLPEPRLPARRDRSRPKLAAGALLLALVLAFAWWSDTRRAEAVGAISITGVSHSSGGTFAITGTWDPSGNQCWGPGNTFHYQVEVYDDPDGLLPVSGTLLANVNPAPCNGDYTSPVAADDRSIGGAWPGPGQGGNTFTLGPGIHRVCVVLRHVSLTGNDIAASTCSAESIAVFAVGKDFVPDSGASVSVSLTCAAGSASPASGSASETTPAVFGIAGFAGDPLCTAKEAAVPAGYSSSGTCSAPASAGGCTIVNQAASPSPTAGPQPTSTVPPGSEPVPTPSSVPPAPGEPPPPARGDPPVITPPSTGSGGLLDSH